MTRSRGRTTAAGALARRSRRRELGARLVGWYARNRRQLPWREGVDPYRVWLSEVMLQQTRVDTVIPYFERFLERFPSLAALARAKEDEVVALWSGLGYYRRARSLLAGARWIVEHHGGKFPRDLQAALRVPGVGPYTAAAVLSIAYGLPHPVIDTNVERVSARVLRLVDTARSAASRRALTAVLSSWMPPQQSGEFNQALMELGATVCTAAAPDCPHCPISSLCAAYGRGEVHLYPAPARRRETAQVTFEVGVLKSTNGFLLERSERWSFLEGLWLFPLEELSPGNGPPSGIAAKLEARLGVPVRSRGELATVRHAITFRRITLLPRLLESRHIDLDGVDNLRWARLDELGKTLPVSSMCLKIAKLLRGSREGVSRTSRTVPQVARQLPVRRR